MSLSEDVRVEREKRKHAAFARREQDILNVAESLMAAQGVRMVSVDVIAARAGIGKGTIYKHFDSKREVLLAIVVRHYRTLTELLTRMADPVQAVVDWMEAQLHAPSRTRLVYELSALLATDAQAVEHIREERDRMRRRMSQILSNQNQAVSDLLDRTMWLESMVRGGIEEMDSPLHRADFDAERLIESLLRAVPVLVETTRAKKQDSRLTYL